MTRDVVRVAGVGALVGTGSTLVLLLAMWLYAIRQARGR